MLQTSLKWWSRHKAEWTKCDRCPLAQDRIHSKGRVCLARGQIPADVLFIGEAPGESENVLGEPFVGPAGQRLDTLIRKAGINSYCITNVIGCLPKGLDNKIRPPVRSEVKACQPRLTELIAVCRPKLIVLVGQTAAKWVCKSIPKDTLFISVTHPAYHLRLPPNRESIETQRWVLTVRQAWEASNA